MSRQPTIDDEFAPRDKRRLIRRQIENPIGYVLGTPQTAQRVARYSALAPALGREHAVPLCLGDPLKRKGFAIWIPSAADAGIVDQYIQLAKARHR